MDIFNINLNNDIDFIIQETGEDIKINNKLTKAIIQNTKQERIYDDKRIITNSKIARGDYVEYNDLFFIVLPEVNCKKYNSYYKSIIRRCNFTIKFIINNKLYLFYSIIEGDKFSIEQEDVFSLSADNITVTLPYTEITRQIKKQDAFIKWGQKWNIEGIDYTKDGLIVLHGKQTLINNSTDDIENEIANRYKDSNDILNGNIDPIYPFDVEDEPTAPEEPQEPEIPEEPQEPEIPEEPQEPTEPEQTYSIIINGYDKIMVGFESTYTATVFNNDEEVDKDVKFEIDDTSLATIVSQDGKSCKIKPNNNYKFGSFNLKAILVEDETVFVEREIKVVGL